MTDPDAVDGMLSALRDLTSFEWHRGANGMLYAEPDIAVKAPMLANAFKWAAMFHGKGIPQDGFQSALLGNTARITIEGSIIRNPSFLDVLQEPKVAARVKKDFEDPDMGLKNRLYQATGLLWHKDYTGFAASPPDATPNNAKETTVDALVAIYRKVAIETGLATERDYSPDRQKLAAVDRSRSANGYSSLVYFTHKAVTDPMFLAAIERDEFKAERDRTVKLIVENDLKTKEEKKHAAIKRLNEVTGKEWILRKDDFQAEWGRYFIDTFNDPDTTLALHRVLHPIGKEAWGFDPYVALQGGLQKSGLIEGLEVDDSIPGLLRIYPEKGFVEGHPGKKGMMIMNNIIESTDFIEKLPDDLRFQIAEELRRIKQARRELQ